MVTEEEVWERLKGIQDPELRQSLVALGMIKELTLAEGRISLTLALTTRGCPRRNQMVTAIKEEVGALPGVTAVEVKLALLPPSARARVLEKPCLVGLARVRHFLAVASGKGGVGKSSVAINLALAMARQGLRVGLLDADIHGPSLPLMLGLSGRPRMVEGRIIPEEKYGLRVVSFGLLVQEGEAVIWRGPLVARAMQQLLGEVEWGELDYLLIDLPPGTGDASISVAQALPKLQVLLVTTPQEAALSDVRRALALFGKQQRQLLGLVENMSFFLCPGCNRPYFIFGQGGAQKLSQESGLPLLAAIPIDLQLRVGGDSGLPLLIAAPDSATAQIFHDLARACCKTAAP